MKRCLLTVLLGACLALSAASTAQAEAECQFVLGFKTLRALIGNDIVGQCLENEHYNEIGDSLQQTTGGLLVWRKADNWTAFTDGYRTWINGPIGLQQRLNTRRFEWEADHAPGGGIATPTPGPVPTSDPTPVPPPAPPEVDPTLGYALQVMRTTPIGEEAFQWFVSSGIGASFGGSEGGEGLDYAIRLETDHSIVIGGGYRNEGPDVLAALLFGSIEWIKSYVEPQSAEECFDGIEAVYIFQARWWHEKFGDAGKQGPGTYWELQENVRLAQHRVGTLGNRIRRSDHIRNHCAQSWTLPPKPSPSYGPVLAYAFQLMRTTPLGERMYHEFLATEAGATIATIRNALALYLPTDNEMVVSYVFRGQSDEVIVLRIVHEIVHAVAKKELGDRRQSAEECFLEEISAHFAVATWWQQKHGRAGKLNPATRWERVENNRLWHYQAGSLDDWVRSIESVRNRCEPLG